MNKYMNRKKGGDRKRKKGKDERKQRKKQNIFLTRRDRRKGSRGRETRRQTDRKIDM